jgi:hypothetical protein
VEKGVKETKVVEHLVEIKKAAKEAEFQYSTHLTTTQTANTIAGNISTPMTKLCLSIRCSKVVNIFE